MAQQKQTYPFYLGGLSAIMACCCTHPVDQTKYRMQVMKVPGAGIIPSVLNSFRTNGVVGVWEGISASMLRQGTYSCARFTLYEYIQSLATQNRSGPTPIWLLATCAGVAGGLAGLIGNPFEIVLVRMCTDGIKPIGERYGYSNGAQAVYVVARDEGTRALYRGLGPNVIRSVLMNVSQLAVYDAMKRSLLASSYNLTDSIPLHLSCGLVAGTIATTLCAPVDVLKSRIQSEATHTTLLQICKTGIRNEGMGFFMRGWTPAWLRLTPNTVIMFLCLEQLKKGVDYLRQPKIVPLKPFAE